MEKPNAFPLREPEFIKLPTTRMISSSWVKFWLLESSSQAAVTDTTSGLMLFSCSSNCSLNRMASSLTFNCFTVDIWQEWRGREVGMRCFLSMDKCVLWEYWRGFFFIYHAFCGAEQSCLCLVQQRDDFLCPTNICNGLSFFSSDAFLFSKFLSCTCG